MDQIPCPDGYLLAAKSPLADAHQALNNLGLAAKVRPAVVLRVPAEDVDRALVTLVPHTTSLRSSRFEVAMPVSFLRAGAFNAQSRLRFPQQSCCDPSASSR